MVIINSYPAFLRTPLYPGTIAYSNSPPPLFQAANSPPPSSPPSDETPSTEGTTAYSYSAASPTFVLPCNGDVDAFGFDTRVRPCSVASPYPAYHLVHPPLSMWPSHTVPAHRSTTTHPTICDAYTVIGPFICTVIGTVFAALSVSIRRFVKKARSRRQGEGRG